MCIAQASLRVIFSDWMKQFRYLDSWMLVIVQRIAVAKLKRDLTQQKNSANILLIYFPTCAEANAFYFASHNKFCRMFFSVISLSPFLLSVFDNFPPSFGLCGINNMICDKCWDHFFCQIYSCYTCGVLSSSLCSSHHILLFFNCVSHVSSSLVFLKFSQVFIF